MPAEQAGRLAAGEPRAAAKGLQLGSELAPAYGGTVTHARLLPVAGSVRAKPPMAHPEDGPNTVARRRVHRIGRQIYAYLGGSAYVTDDTVAV
ncbi:hypothetical protein Sgou_57270 [Streptomyces gougerotii]|uniref:Uncharacterized protein n=2 Tax=Streptomyces diastaticus group TaxID=2849069 RepID=A0ABQ1DES4_9ACTN|nr:hypothetical protein Srut_34890 [Streptomyces rutgersensis]GFH72258.1 hypothetical protein Sdia_30260 [Streptomyces diastaticus subsp. diastaticus]GFH81057.1 hypothetical protein Sgou_57270 [Streptomyces gougerotii]GGU26882.1 hypothetical protein GCM10015534_31870 [Streptomyces diastaticus subsp. diastaticus]